MSHLTGESGPNHDLFAFEDQPPPLDTDFNFQQKPKTDELVGDFHKFDDTFDVKPNPMQSSGQKDSDLLGDFLAHERQAPTTVPRPKDSPPAIPTFEAFDVQVEINNRSEEKHEDEGKDVVEEDFGQIQPDYLNPYATVGKLESNEKFISTDDLIGLSDNEGKADKENAFEDCNKDEEEEDQQPPQVAKVEQSAPPVKPEPVKETPKPVVAPATVAEPPKPKVLPPQSNPKKPVELLEAEKIFMRCGLGKSNFFFSTISIFITHQCCARSQNTDGLLWRCI